MIPETQNQFIWGDGWYAIYDKEHNYWWVSPITFFEKHHHCPDGWEWEEPPNMTDDEFEEFIDEYGCEPTPPKGFSYCMESCISCNTDISYEDQEKAFVEAGFKIKEYKF